MGGEIKPETSRDEEAENPAEVARRRGVEPGSYGGSGVVDRLSHGQIEELPDSIFFRLSCVVGEASGAY